MVTRIDDRNILREYFRKDVINSCYHLADLNDDNFKRCSFYANIESGIMTSVLLVYNHPRAATILSLGESAGVGEIISRKGRDLPGSFYFHLFDDHLLHAERAFTVNYSMPFYRMYIKKEERPPVKTAMYEIKQLGPEETEMITDLLLHHPGNFFTRAMLLTGYYYGAIDNGRLAAMAGVHAFSEKEGIAVLGNVVTREECRNGGYADACVNILLNKLFDKVDMVALNVKSDNTPALRLYEKTGFRTHSSLTIGHGDNNR